MELLKSAYNPITNEIISADEGSLIWWHESGHRWLNHLGYYRIHWLLFRFFSLGIIIYFAIIPKPNPYLMILAWTGLDGGHEIAAWLYAFWHKYIVKNISEGP